MKRIFAMVLLMAFSTVLACQPGSSVVGKSRLEAVPIKGEMMSAREDKKFLEPKAPAVDVAKKYTAVITTSKGEIVAELYPKDAPLSVTNFKMLADGGYYTGLTFHRVVPGFVIQGGDPTGTGSGGPGYTIPAEIGKPHNKGALAWARLGDEVNPKRRSSGSQFYITLEPTPSLDGQYTVFGQTVKGMDIVGKIQKGDRIEAIEVRAE